MSLVAGSMIGSGILLLRQLVARDIGSAAWLLVIWLVTGLITVAAALSYGELAGMMPKAGGQFVYIQRSYGRLVSLYGWTVLQLYKLVLLRQLLQHFHHAAYIFPSIRHRPFKWGMVLCFHTKSFGCFKHHLLTYINTQGVKSGKGCN
jgi:APA family basic amino acid/polyamine antiporter